MAEGINIPFPVKLLAKQVTNEICNSGHIHIILDELWKYSHTIVWPMFMYVCVNYSCLIGTLSSYTKAVIFYTVKNVGGGIVQLRSCNSGDSSWVRVSLRFFSSLYRHCQLTRSPFTQAVWKGQKFESLCTFYQLPWSSICSNTVNYIITHTFL